MSAASAGFVTEPVGFVLSTRTVIVAEVKELPALSVVMDAEVVLAVGLEGRVPAGGLVRPGAGAGGGALEGDGVDARAAGVGGVARQADRAAHVGGVGGAVIEPVGSVLSTRTVIVAEVKELPALSVGDDAEVVLAVCLQGRVPARGLVRPGARADRRALELNRRDARAAGVGGVARQADRARARWRCRPER